MKKLFFLITIIFLVNIFSFSQNRRYTQGAVYGELYITGLWYGIYASQGFPYCKELRMGLYRLTENGKKLTVQYSADYFANPDVEMQPTYILSDATVVVVYNVNRYYKGEEGIHTQLCVSFDYGINWIIREENVGRKDYYTTNFDGTIHRGGADITRKYFVS